VRAEAKRLERTDSKSNVLPTHITHVTNKLLLVASLIAGLE